MRKERQITNLHNWKCAALIFCFINFNLVLKLGSQTIVKSNLIWSAISFRLTPQLTYLNNQSVYTRFDTDSVVNGIHYFQVLQSTDSLMANWSAVALIREEDEKVFIKSFYYNNEYPIYDFNLAVGEDFIANNYFDYPDTFKVVSIDTISLFGKDRKRYILNDRTTSNDEIWIEGIGSLQGVTRSCYKGTGAWTLLCQYEDSELTYHDSTFVNCYYAANRIILNNDLNLSASKFNIFPNPFQKSISISSNLPYKKIEIFDCSGKLIFSKSAYKKVLLNEKINLEILKPGLYYLVLTSETYRITRTLIKIL